MAKSGKGKRQKQKSKQSAHAATPVMGEAVMGKSGTLNITPAFKKQIEQLFVQAMTFQANNQLEEAEQTYRAILDIFPNHVPSLIRLAEISLEAGRNAVAFKYAREAVWANHAFPEAHRVLGDVLNRIYLTEEAERELSIALQLDNQDCKILHSLGVTYNSQGRFDEAHELFRRAIDMQPDFIHSYFLLANTKRFTSEDEDFALLINLADRIESSNKEDQILIHFILAKIFHDCGEFDQAFREYQIGNDLKAKEIGFDIENHEESVDRIIATQDRSWIRQHGDSGNPSEGAIFIIGMPRSGTTLLESLLCRHPQISGIGEPPYIQNLATTCKELLGSDLQFPEIVRDLTPEVCKELGGEYLRLTRQFGNATSHTVDKTPANFLYLGFILAILPNARCIHNYRDPLDNCLSIYQALFGTGVKYSYDLRQIGRYYLSYRKIMAHWKQLFPEKILDVNYEDVVVDTEQQLRSVMDFCGLPWDDRCVDDRQKKHVTATASVWQARQPVYRTSVKRWRKYEKHLGPLLEVLSPVLDENAEPLFD